MAEWWPLTPLKGWDPALPEHMKHILGTEGCIPSACFLAMQVRQRRLEISHYSEKNRDPTKNSRTAKAAFGEDGTMEVEGMKVNYLSPTSVQEIILALNNMHAAFFQIFPWDWTPLVLMRVAINLDFFSLVKNEVTRVKIFEDFINQVLKENAEGYRRPPKTYMEAMETAKIVCARYIII